MTFYIIVISLYTQRLNVISGLGFTDLQVLYAGYIYNICSWTD